MTLNTHQLKQQEVINRIESEVNNKSLSFSTVAPVADYANDSRLCLTSVHLPHSTLLNQIQQDVVEPLREIEPTFHYYPNDCLHMTIKNVRVINDPPHFNETDVQKAKKVFSETIPQHTRFNVYFYRLLMFPNNLALIGTTDAELDNIVLDLDSRLNNEGVPDDKTYLNSRYFFSNMTLVRFNNAPSEKFKQKVSELSKSLKFQPYQVDSVTLLSCNAALEHRQLKGTWKLA
jgi:hypothetical protein